jgi:t-SNARE complex subunit (syntaxin)
MSDYNATDMQSVWDLVNESAEREKKLKAERDELKREVFLLQTTLDTARRSWGRQVIELSDKLTKANAERDELLAALEGLVEMLDIEDLRCDWKAEFEAGINAIAKAKGGEG